jgi:8-oxo-dGTP pyrophosphatase MutT (NUDIX family)
MTPAPKRYTENQDSRPDFRTQSSSFTPKSGQSETSSESVKNNSNFSSSQAKTPYIPQLPPTPPRSQPNTYKVPASGSIVANSVAPISRDIPVVVSPSPRPVVENTYVVPTATVPTIPLTEPTLEELDALRKQGLRPSVVGCFLNDKKVLLVYKKDFNLWQLPQGGIENKDDLHKAFFRELGEEVTDDFVKSCDPDIQLISVDKIEFPPSKQGLRDLMTDAGEPITMKGKFYYAVVASAKDQNITIGATEFDDCKWLNFDEAYKLIKETNTGGKLRLTTSILHLLKDKNLISTNPVKENDTRPDDGARRFASDNRFNRTNPSRNDRNPSNDRSRDSIHSTGSLGQRHDPNPRRDTPTQTGNLPMVSQPAAIIPATPLTPGNLGDSNKE